MLKEMESVRQRPDEGFRRWFRDADFDLVVFFPAKDNGEITGFQLCYRQNRGNEYVFSWYKTGGASHTKIDTGESEPLRYKKSPVLVADGFFAAETVLEKFLAAAKNIPPDIYNEVKKQITEYSACAASRKASL